MFVMNQVIKALNIAWDQHKDQKRKCNNSPYFTHILDVARLLLAESDVSEDIVIAGILHDTLEDTEYTAKQLERDFGPHILSLVQFATEPDKESHTSKEEKKKTWKLRKQHTINSCKKASRDQLLILLADKLSNIQSLKEDYLLFGNTVWDHFNAPREDIAWYYRSLQNLFKEKLGNTRLFELYNKLVNEVLDS